MNKVKLNELIKDGNIVIPLYLFKIYKKYKLNMEEFVFLMYLYNKDDMIFNPLKISIDLNIDLMEVMGYISTITDKGLISLDVSKNEKGVLEEKINLNHFYEKVTLSLMEALVTEEESNSDSIYQVIEQEFNRKLSNLEIDTVKGWQKNNISDELIIEALKESSLNGVNNLRYMDKILFEWDKKGIKNKDDVFNSKNYTEKNQNDIEIYNYDWLEDE